MENDKEKKMGPLHQKRDGSRRFGTGSCETDCIFQVGAFKSNCYKPVY